ncbi:relaxase/mobilization nuclease domain-containing protein [Helicobacter cappadocius]|uniref:Relaxase/mobilization nuclease domain-containing protein n=1 Tax=Helicobacter cappadocius TaxID=3063998 RepID=A0AA90TAB8_9HELI|nr:MULTISPECIES: relaxase/mobilization nuclease domain-containing protein [unclassified Helicobacter]MDO7253921.1 relaxase/mobilization nuclease domain-containing protein [Helicobacter sp. faydin-H75]MDP2539782.1 relaxase/mobilization nuclease domain-containing protein [Helicobacter sp. faydin-H76]
MRVITNIPVNYKLEDDSLFEFVPIKRMRKSITDHSSLNSNHSHIFFKSFKSFNSKNEKSYANDNHKNVVIKNIGNMKQKHLKNALDYVLKNSEDKKAINESFELKSYKEVLEDWQTDFSLNQNTNEAMHLVFSLKESHCKSIMEILKTSVYETMKSNFSEYQFVMIPHTHQNNPHIHCLVNKTNIWTGKKLRFAKKSDCRDFFFKLKEDFKNDLYHFSGGKLDYKNDVRLKLDSIFQEFQTINEESKTFNHRGFYSEAIKNLNTQYFKTTNSIKVLESKMASLYAEKNNKPEEIEVILKKIASHNQRLQELKKEMENLSNWDQNFNHFTKSFNLFEKKKTLYDSIIKIKPYASKSLFKHLSVLENQLSYEKVFIQQGVKDINEGFDKNIFLNEKTHMFGLNRHLKQIKNYRRMLKEFQAQDSDFKPNEVLDKINAKEKEVLELIEARITRLLSIHQNLKLDIDKQKERLDERLNDISKLSFEDISEIIKLSSLHLRNLKALSFVAKELLLAKKILKDTQNTPLKQINQKNQNQIALQIKEIQQFKEAIKEKNNNIRG